MGYKYRSLAVANFIGAGYKELLDCEDLRCLQSESADELIHVQDTLIMPLYVIVIIHHSLSVIIIHHHTLLFPFTSLTPTPTHTLPAHDPSATSSPGAPSPPTSTTTERPA
jgi:hypothetical protein